MGLRKHQIFTFRNADVDSWVEGTGWVPGSQELEDSFGTTTVVDIAHDFLDHDWYKLSQGECGYLNEMRALGGAENRYLYRWDVSHYHDEKGLFQNDFDHLLEGWTREDDHVQDVRAYRVPSEYQDYLEEVTEWIQESWKAFYAYNKEDFEEGYLAVPPLVATKKMCRKLASYYVRGYMDAIKKWGEFWRSVDILLNLNKVANDLAKAFESRCWDNVEVRFMVNTDTNEVTYKIQDPELERWHYGY